MLYKSKQHKKWGCAYYKCIGKEKLELDLYTEHPSSIWSYWWELGIEGKIWCKGIALGYFLCSFFSCISGWYSMWQWHIENVYCLWDKVKPIGLYPRMDLLWVFIAILFLSIKYLLNSTRFIVFKIELYNWSLELGRY